MWLGNFTSMINALIAIFAVRRHLQILRATMTVGIPLSINSRSLRTRKRCAKRRWRDVLWKLSAAMVAVSRAPETRRSGEFYLDRDHGLSPGLSFSLCPNHSVDSSSKSGAG